MAELKNDDLLLVNRAGETYTAPGEAIYASYLTKPEIGNFTLVESNPGVLPRFTDQEFVATLTMTEEGQPVSKKTYDAYVEGTILEDIESSIIVETEVIDGNWALGTGSGSSNWTSITYGNSKFIAVANGGGNRVMSSDDGISWTSSTGLQEESWKSVTFGNGKFVAVSATGSNRFMYSDDGNTWTQGIPDDNTLQDITWDAVTYGDDKFVAIGPGTAAMYSDDGINWLKTSIDSGSWYSVTYGNDKFVAVSGGSGPKVKYSDDGITWTDAGVTGVPNSDWRAVAYGNGKFVATAITGTNRVMYSTDGISWTATAATEANQWFGVTYGANKFVAVSYDGTNRAMYSDDGITWNTATDADGEYVAVTYGDNKFVAVGINGDVMWSNTGTDEENTKIVLEDNTNLDQLVEGDQVEMNSAGTPITSAITNVALVGGQTELTLTDNTNLANFRVGDTVTETGGDGTGTITEVGATSLTLSPFGGTWSNAATVTGPTFTAVAELVSVDEPNNNLTVKDVTGRFLETKPGQTLNRLDKTVLQKNVPVDGTKKYLAFTGTGAVTGLLDTPQAPAYVTTEENPTLTLTFPSTFPSGFTPDEELGEGVTLTVEVTAENAAGTDGPVSDTVQPSLDIIQFNEPLESSTIVDGSWNSEDPPGDNGWWGVTYGGTPGVDGKFVAVAYEGTNDVMYSDDAITWTLSVSADEGIRWQEVTYGDGMYVAVEGQIGRAMYSTDGIGWTLGTGIPRTGWSDVTYSDGKFVAVAAATNATNGAMYSTDGISWRTAGTTPPVQWRGIAYGNGRFVAVGSITAGLQRVMWSDDGTNNWTVANAAEPNNWQSVAYGDGKFVAVSSNGTNHVMYSTDDGISWTAASDAGLGGSWMKVTYGDGYFVAVGQSATMSSPDGINWTVVLTEEANTWQSVTYGDGKFVAVSRNGTNRVLWSNTGTGEDDISLNFNTGTDMTTLEAGDAVSQGATAGTVGTITGTTVALATSTGAWVTEANGGANVIGPDKTPIRSLTADELDAQKLKFLTYNNRKEVVCGEEAAAAREALLATLVAAGYTEADINQAYSNLDN